MSEWGFDVDDALIDAMGEALVAAAFPDWDAATGEPWQLLIAEAAGDLYGLDLWQDDYDVDIVIYGE